MGEVSTPPGPNSCMHTIVWQRPWHGHMAHNRDIEKESRFEGSFQVETIENNTETRRQNRQQWRLSSQGNAQN